MVLHGIALYDLVFYIIYFAFFCVFRFVARAVSRKTPIPLIIYHIVYIYIEMQSLLTIYMIKQLSSESHLLSD